MTPNTPNAGYRFGTLPTVPYVGKPLSNNHGAKVPIHQRVTTGLPRQNLSFTGRGFVPDYMSDHALTMMPELSAGTLEGGIVPGSEGMMPPPGRLNKVQLGQAQDSGSSGAGSFATVSAFGAKG